MARIFGCILGLCLLLGASGARAAEPPAAKATLDRAIAALPSGWSVRYADVSEGSDGILTLKDVVLSHDGKLLLAAASVAVAGLHGDGSAAAPFAADRVVATALSEARGADPSAADSLVATGLSVGPGDAGGLPAGSRAAAIVQALTAVRVDHAELTHLHDKGGAVSSVTLDRLARGHVDAAAISDFLFQQPSPDGEKHMTIASIEANDVDIARLVQVFEPSAYASPKDAAGKDGPDAGGTDPRRLAIGPAIGRFAVHGVVQTQGDMSNRMDALELTDVRLGQLPEAPTETTVWTVPAVIGAAVIGGMHHRPANDNEERFDLASIALSNYRTGGFDSVQVSGATFAEPGTHIAFGLKSAVIRGFNAAGLMGWAATKPDDRDASPPAPRLGGFELTGLFADIPTGDRITVGSIRDALDYRDEAPVSQDLTISRLTVPAHALAPVVGDPALAAFGRDSVTADLQFRVVWNPDTHDLALAPFQVTADGLGTLTLQLAFGNVDLSLLPKGALQAMAGMAVATIKGGDLVYADHSLLDRALAGYAAMNGQTPQQVRQMLVGMLTQMKSPLPSRPLLPATLAGFIQHPGTLTIRITPPTPVPAAMLAAGEPDETAKQLGLEVTAK